VCYAHPFRNALGIFFFFFFYKKNIVKLEGMHIFTSITNVFDYEEPYKGELKM
jgi:hypothetical protein